MAAERRWLDGWIAGPRMDGKPVRRGERAPDVELTAEDGSRVALSSHWDEQPALVMLWRHLGCGCGLERLDRLKGESAQYTEAGLTPVVVAPGEIERVVAYKERYGLPVPVLADPDYQTHRLFGLSHWSREQVLYDLPDEYCDLTRESGEAYQAARREIDLLLGDDPWMQSGEFVVDPDGIVRVAYLYNYCADFPDPRVFTTAARLARPQT